jgi:Flp pilus assembly protein TadG
MPLRQPKACARRGVTLVECAVIYPVVFFILLALLIGGMAIYRYQEVAALARSGARYASTHGAQYRKDTNLPVGSPGTSAGTSGGLLWYQANPMSAPGSDTSWTGDIYDQAIRPQLIALDPSQLSVQVGWPPVKNPSGTVVLNNPDNWPGSTVTVTVTYQWFPELWLVGPITLTSTSTMPITN